MSALTLSFSEFGDIKGQLVWIDLMPCHQIRFVPSTAFPSKVQIDQQSILLMIGKFPCSQGCR